MCTPEPERQGVEGTVMDEDICQGVMAGKAAEENLLMVGGVDDDDDDAEILPRPSRKATLEAAATLERYVSVLEESSGYARKLENLLMSFGRQTHFEETQSMVNTLIMDHFYTNIHD